MKVRNVLFGFFLMIGLLVCAQVKQSIQGCLKGVNQNMVGGVLIEVKGHKQKAISDRYGHFSLQLPYGVYVLHIHHKNKNIEIAKVYFKDAAVTQINIDPDSNATNIEEIKVIGRKKPRYTDDKTSSDLRLNIPLLNLAQNIQVVTKDVLDDQSSLNITDGVERNVSGIYRVEHQPYTSMYIRGLSVDHNNFRDGMRFQGFHGPMSEDMSFVNAVEFVKGPYSAMLSNTPPGGFYNINIKKPTGQNKRDITLSLGSFDTYRADADIEGAFTKEGNFQYRIATMGQKKRSHVKYQFDDGFSVAPSLRYKNNRFDVSAVYIYRMNKKNNYANYIGSGKGFKDQARGLSFSSNKKDPLKLDEHNVFVNAEFKITKNWKASGKFGYLRYRSYGTNVGVHFYAPVDYATGTAAQTFSLIDNLNINKVGQFMLSGDFYTNSVKHNLITGFDIGQFNAYADWSILKQVPYNIYNQVPFRKDENPSLERFSRGSLKQRALDYNTDPLNPYKMVNNPENNYHAFYLQDQISFLDDKIRLGLGGRYTHSKKLDSGFSFGRITKKETKNDVFSPRVSLGFTYMPDATVYGLYDNTFEENFGLVKDKGAAKPSFGRNLELGFKNKWLSGLLNTTLALYYIKKSNITIADAANNGFVIQTNKAESKGIEFDLQGDISNNISAVINYAYTDAKGIDKDAKGNKIKTPLKGSARHITNAWLTYRFDSKVLSGLGISMGYRWAAHRFSWGGSAIKDAKLPNDYFSLDASISYKKPKYSIAFTLNNITDRYNYEGIGKNSPIWRNEAYLWTAHPPRNFLLSVSYHF